jgi:hypothetical protein
MYDSTDDTMKHIKRVQNLLRNFSIELMARGSNHDYSKLCSPEKETFDIITPKLKGSTYGSEEYKKTMEESRTAIEHHQKNNSHHPEYYQNGINGFTLLDLVEMFFDWKAATERHADGDIRKSLQINKTRFNISDQLCDILENTIRHCFDDEQEEPKKCQ